MRVLRRFGRITRTPFPGVGDTWIGLRITWIVFSLLAAILSGIAATALILAWVFTGDTPLWWASHACTWAMYAIALFVLVLMVLIVRREHRRNAP